MSSIASALASTSPTTGSPSAAASSTSVTDSSDPLGNESTFLTLLVSQLQNQDPLDPTDSNQFISQLTGYSQLEQLININQNTAPATASATSPTTTPTTSPTTGNS